MRDPRSQFEILIFHRRANGKIINKLLSVMAFAMDPPISFRSINSFHFVAFGAANDIPLYRESRRELTFPNRKLFNPETSERELNAHILLCSHSNGELLDFNRNITRSSLLRSQFAEWKNWFIGIERRTHRWTKGISSFLSLTPTLALFRRSASNGAASIKWIIRSFLCLMSRKRKKNRENWMGMRTNDRIMNK